MGPRTLLIRARGGVQGKRIPRNSGRTRTPRAARARAAPFRAPWTRPRLARHGPAFSRLHPVRRRLLETRLLPQPRQLPIPLTPTHKAHWLGARTPAASPAAPRLPNCVLAALCAACSLGRPLRLRYQQIDGRCAPMLGSRRARPVLLACALPKSNLRYKGTSTPACGTLFPALISFYEIVPEVNFCGSSVAAGGDNVN